MKKKRILLSAGGTGGHLFPAQAVARELSECDCLFVGGGLNKSPYFAQNDFRFFEINTSTFSLRKPHKIFSAGVKIASGIFESRKIISEFQPDLVVGFGSFFTLPLLCGALLEKIPILLHEQNSIPGKVNRLFSRYAKVTAVTFPDSKQWLKGKSVETSFPLRFDPENSRRRQEALSYYHFKSHLPTLLVFGGSQGAQKLNRLFLEASIALPPDIQILHFVGNSAMKLEAEESYKKANRAHVVKEFEKRMDLALSLADVAVCRAGASTIAELIEWEIPAFLIPFPFASERHQDYNAKHFVENVMGGEMILENEVTLPYLAQKVGDLLKKRDAYRENIALYKVKRDVKRLKNLILEAL